MGTNTFYGEPKYSVFKFGGIKLSYFAQYINRNKYQCPLSSQMAVSEFKMELIGFGYVNDEREY